MRKVLYLFLSLSILPAAASPQSIGVHYGMGGIEGHYHDSGSDLFIGLQLDYSRRLATHYTIEGGILATGSLPFMTLVTEGILSPIDPSYSLKIADFNSYYLGAKADYDLLPFWNIYLHGGFGYAKVSEYSPEIQSNGSHHYNKANCYSGIHPYIGVGTEIRPYSSLGFSLDLRYDDLPHSYKGTALLFGLNFHF